MYFNSDAGLHKFNSVCIKIVIYEVLGLHSYLLSAWKKMKKVHPFQTLSSFYMEPL